MRDCKSWEPRESQDIGLGDDSECIEDDFDVWQEEFLQTLKSGKEGSRNKGNRMLEKQVEATPAQ